MSKIAVICNTMNEYHKAKMGLGVTLSNAGKDYDLFIWDNGSKNDRIKDLVKSFKPKFLHYSEENVGNPVAYNQMLLRVKEQGYDYVAMIAPDIVLPNNWLALSESIYSRCKLKGFLGYDWGYRQERNLEMIEQVPLQHSDNVYGCWFFSTKLLDKVGFINEEYKMYGRWDSDWNFRINASGLKSYYLPPIEMLKSIHLTSSWKDNSTEYRKFKDKWLRHNTEIEKKELLKYAKTNNFYIAPPKKIEL